LYLVVGLGNPGKKYEKHRHNVGFMTVDRLHDAVGLPAWKEKFSGVFSRGTAFGEDVMLLKPMTFMNLSGDSVQPAAAFVKADPSHVIVVHDELDLPFGDVRLKLGGGHAGHNGLRSIIERLGADFLRVRVGVGRPPPGFRGEVADFVLSGFDPVESASIPDIVSRALDAVRLVCEKGFSQAQNVVNTKKT
jgi:PTH1 family peptidyl-tRNA hydrolase